MTFWSYCHWCDLEGRFWCKNRRSFIRRTFKDVDNWTVNKKKFYFRKFSSVFYTFTLHESILDTTCLGQFGAKYILTLLNQKLRVPKITRQIDTYKEKSVQQVYIFLIAIWRSRSLRIVKRYENIFWLLNPTYAVSPSIAVSVSILFLFHCKWVYKSRTSV